MLGLIVAAGAAAASQGLGIPGDEGASDALGQGLALAGLLLVPAAIFTAVIGAMFPNYWRATPQALVRYSPHEKLLSVLAVTIGYGAAATATQALVPTTWLVALPMLAGAAVGSVMVIWLTGYSLAIMDPLRLVDVIRAWGARARNPDDLTLAIHDLGRLVRGMVERERKHVATVAIEAIAELLPGAGPDHAIDRPLIGRILGEAADCWGYDAALLRAVERCRAALGGPEQEQGASRADAH